MSDPVYWNGEPLEKLSRAELEDVVRILAQELAQLRTPERARAYGLGAVEMMKRGERP